MKENIEILNEWHNSILNFKKLSFAEAKQLITKIEEENDAVEKEKLREKLITGTLYVIDDFINKNFLWYFCGTSYDMNDVISSCCEIWINRLDDGQLLKKQSFFQIFNSNFYKELQSYLVGETKETINLYAKDMGLTNKNLIEKLSKFANSIKGNADAEDDSIILDFESDVFTLLDDPDTLGVTNNFLNVSNTQLYCLRDIIIYFILESSKENIMKFAYNDTSSVIDKVYEEEIIEVIDKDSKMTSREKDILKHRLEIAGNVKFTLQELGLTYGVTRETIRQNETYGLRRLRHPVNTKKIKIMD